MNTDGCKRTKLLLLFSLFVVCNIFLFALTIQRTSHSTQSQGFMVTQRPCYQRGSSWQDSAGNRTTRRPPYHRKETQTAVVWSCFPFIRSGHNHLARHSERKKTRQTEEEVGRQHQGMDRPGIRQVPKGNGEQRKMEETGREVICGAPTTLAVKGQVKVKVRWT